MNQAKIMIVDDEPLIIMGTRTRLKNMGYEAIATAGSGEDAVEKADQFHPDIIFMDIWLRGNMDGIKASEFDKYVQSSKAKKDNAGTGLGLAICREIIRAHQGEIWAEKNQGAGVTFRLRYPIGPISEKPAARDLIIPQNGSDSSMGGGDNLFFVLPCVIRRSFD